MSNKIITPTKLAKRWGVTPRTIHRLINAGELPPRKKLHKRSVWFESTIEEYEKNLPKEDENSMELVK